MWWEQDFFPPGNLDLGLLFLQSLGAVSLQVRPGTTCVRILVKIAYSLPSPRTVQSEFPVGRVPESVVLLISRATSKLNWSQKHMHRVSFIAALITDSQDTGSLMSTDGRLDEEDERNIHAGILLK